MPKRKFADLANMTAEERAKILKPYLRRMDSADCTDLIDRLNYVLRAKGTDCAALLIHQYVSDDLAIMLNRPNMAFLDYILSALDVPTAATIRRQNHERFGTVPTLAKPCRH